MSLRCPDCKSPAVHIIDTNGAEYPETRVETYECDHGHEFKKVLTA
jgi:hypothetical protein